MESPEMKSCKVCAMRIPAAARVCPYCRKNPGSRLFAFHSFMGPIMAIVLLGGVFCLFSRLTDSGEPFANHAGELTVTDSRIVFGGEGDKAWVGVIGTLHNKGTLAWKDVTLHVEYRDADNVVVDVGQWQPWRYDCEVPAGADLSFEVSANRKYPKAGYVSHAVRVISAKDARSRW